jgi:hypothetical protein
VVHTTPEHDELKHIAHGRSIWRTFLLRSLMITRHGRKRGIDSNVRFLAKAVSKSVASRGYSPSFGIQLETAIQSIFDIFYPTQSRF